MKYYEAHEVAYKQKLAQGLDSWDGQGFDNFVMRPLLEKCLRESEIDVSGARCLELGCGTGPLSCMLAGLGADVTGIDISSLAIEKAKEMAAERSLEVDFRVGDLCADVLPESGYDVIVDNHFFHCIIYPDEREKVLENIRQALKPGGEFWTETMVGFPTMEPRDDWRMDENGITWSIWSKASDAVYEPCELRDGQYWMPIRFIQPDGDAMKRELEEAGFDVNWFDVVIPERPNDTADFRARCTVKNSSENR